MTENPEDLIADEFDLETDPLERFNSGMQKYDVDWYEHYMNEYVENKDIKNSYKDKYRDAFDDWKSFMEEHYPERHPTLANQYQIEAWVKSLCRRMRGDNARKQINLIKEVYEWMQDSQRFPHPEEYHPYALTKRKLEGHLKAEDAKDHPEITLDDVREVVESIKHVGERAATVFQLKTGVRSTELANIRLSEIHITNADVLNHYDGSGQSYGAMGSHSQLNDRSNAVFIPPEDVRDGNKRECPTVIPLDDETRRVLIDWLLIRPDNSDPHLFLTQKGKPLERNSLRHVWTKHWHPEYEFDEGDEYRSISPHFSRHWFSSWFRAEAQMSEPRVQYLRGDKQGPDIGNSRSAMHRYIRSFYEDIEAEYRDSVFKLGL